MLSGGAGKGVSKFSGGLDGSGGGENARRCADEVNGWCECCIMFVFMNMCVCFCVCDGV